MKNFKIPLLGLLAGLLLFISCSDNENNEITFENEKSFEQQILELPNNSYEGTEIIKLYAEAMKEVLVLAKDSEFRDFLYEKSLNQNGGDYNVYIDNIANSFTKSGAYTKSIAKLSLLSSRIENVNGGLRTVVFFPKAETIEDAIREGKSYQIAKSSVEPVAVLKGAYNNDYSVPGYTIDDNGDLAYNRDVTEEDAWENDVYVIGAEESYNLPNSTTIVEPCEDVVNYNNNDSKSILGGCYGGGGGGTGSSNTRTDGRTEYGGLIKIDSPNEIEHWLSGKFEFRIVVAGVSGSSSLVIKDKAFVKLKRKHVKNHNWYNFNEFLFNWNKSNLGNWNVENWFELDGGKSTEVTISMPSQNGGPSVSVKIPSQNKDDNLGKSIVQFTDNLSQIYPISYMRFKRK